MKSTLFILIAFVLFVTGGCTKSFNVKYPPTLAIDSVEYDSIRKEFSLLYVAKPDKYLGGLTPNYPMAIAGESCEHITENDWMVGGFICVVPKPLLKIKGKYVLINNKQDLKKMYAPITTADEAMGYAILFTKGFPIFNKKEFKKEYTYFDYTPSVSSSVKDNNGYIVKLFSYKAFGCDHPYNEIIIRVHENGEVEKISDKKVFKDPKDNGMCVD